MWHSCALPLYLPVFSFSSLPGSSTCPKITLVPPCVKSSTTPLVDQNVSDEEAQGINGKTPAKHSAASPKPQGMLGGSFFFKSGWVFCSLVKSIQKNDND